MTAASRKASERQSSGSLVSRLEAAEFGHYGLDDEISVALGLTLSHPFGARTDLRPFTTSVDAAEWLVQKVLPGWWWAAGKCGLTCHASVGPDRAFIAEPDLLKYDEGFHADVLNPSTPAIALCVAILRAKDGTRPET